MFIHLLFVLTTGSMYVHYSATAGNSLKIINEQMAQKSFYFILTILYLFFRGIPFFFLFFFYFFLLFLFERNHQQKDGGWGTHIESPSTMFGSTLSYVTMRLLGVSPDDVALVQARVFMHSHGGALYTSSWAKFWLSVLGVYEYVFLDFLEIEFCVVCLLFVCFFFWLATQFS